MKHALVIRHAAPETLAANFTGILEGQGFRLGFLNVFDGAPAYERFDAPDLGDLRCNSGFGWPAFGKR